MVMEVVHEDMGEGSMHCTNHTHKNSTPGGICGSCLQEKLGKLVSSSSSVPIFPSSSPSSSSSPFFRSDVNGSTSTTSAFQVQHHLSSSSASSQNGGNDSSYNNGYGTRRSRLGFVLTNKKNKKKDEVQMESADPTRIVFNRSKSTRTPRRGMHFLNDEDYSPHRRGFWSFLYLSKHSTVKKDDKHYKDLNFTSATPSTVSSSVGLLSVDGTNTTGGVVGSGGAIRLREQKREDLVVVEENGSSPDDDQAKFDRKVSRSRSVGCGSRSFSGDFFERLSTGFGDCTLRRVESQREGKAKVHSIHRNSGSNRQDCIKERVRCGGIFSGFMITSSSSSSSSSLNYVSASEDSNVKGKSITAAAHSSMVHVPPHVRSKSWGWAFASPMRAFSKPSADGRKGANSKKNATPNLNAIPSLLAVSG